MDGESGNNVFGDWLPLIREKMVKSSIVVPCKLRNKSWKPECVGSFNMDWRILVFYPEPEARDKIY
jgi:hypothetical protein